MIRSSHLLLVMFSAFAVADVARADSGISATSEPEPPAPRYPRSVIDRPLTLPEGLLSAGADFGGNHDLSAMTTAPIIGYGITDKLEIQVPYAFGARALEPRGLLGADLGYMLLRGALDGKLEAIARVRGGYSVLDNAPAPLMIGVHVQYNALPWLAFITGAPGTQQLRISLANDKDSMKPMDLSLPLGIGLQPFKTLYLEVDTKIAQWNLHQSQNALLFKDTTPVSLTAVWNVLPQLDVQGSIGTDVSNSPGNALSFLIGARYYAGQL